MRTLIVDDERAARDVLRRDLAQVESVDLVGEADNGATALERIKELRPDLVLLDIQMPVQDGFEVVRCLHGRLPLIVFVTAYSEHTLKAFEVGAIDYLLKPFSVERLTRSIERAQQSTRNPRDYAERVAQTINAAPQPRHPRIKIVACHGRDFILLDLDHVYAFQASGEIVWIQTRERRYQATQTLTAIAAKLAGTEFLRVHRGALVNSNKISRISSLSSRRWLLTLANGSQYTVSKRNAAMVRALLQ